MRLAYFSPLPPTRSGIADYSRELLPHLARQATVHLFVSEPAQVVLEEVADLPRYPLDAYPQRRWHYDVALYQMGNSRHHESLYRIMRRYPGIMVLHDYALHHFIADRTAGRQNQPGYVRELGYALGTEGVNLAWATRYGEREQEPGAFPLNDRLLDLNLGTLVHSHYAREMIAGGGQAHPVEVVPALITARTGQSRRSELPWPEDALIFASVGQITRAKRLDLALRAFVRLRRQVPRARYLIVGECLPEVDLNALVAGLELEEVVYHTGFSDTLDTFVDWLSSVDVVLNLRQPTLGETSASALRALAAGCPLVVYDHGWYGELPADVAVKVPPADEDALVQALLALAQDGTQRARMGTRARAYVEEAHAPAAAAAAYVSAIHRILEEIGPHA